jgi:hypothetical protein
VSVTLREVLAAARARRASVAAELAGYLVLAAADQVAGAPRLTEPADIELGEDGSVRASGGAASSAADAERSLRSLLSRLLEVASSATPALIRAAQSPAAAGVDALVVELETALIPVNRSASRRALARLHRETARAFAAGHVEVGQTPPRPPADLPPPPNARNDAAPELVPAMDGPPTSRSDAAAEPAPIVDELASRVDEPAPRSDELHVPDLVLPLAASPEPPVARSTLTFLPDVAPRPLVLVETETCPEPVMVRASARRNALAAVRAGTCTPALGTLAQDYPAYDLPPSPTEPMDFAATDPMFECEFMNEGDLAADEQVESLLRQSEELDAEEDWIEVDDFEACDDDALGVFDDEIVSVPCPDELAPAPDSDDLAGSALAAWTDEDVERGWSGEPSAVQTAGAPPGPSRETAAPEPAPRFAPRRSDVSELLASFRVDGTRSERDVCRDLKRIADVGPTLSDTPPPAAAGERRNR